MASVRDWMDYSHGDLVDAHHNTLPRNQCFHAQQSIEKALKAAIIAEGMQFSHTHDLDILAQMLPNSWTVKNMSSNFSSIVICATKSRYPDNPAAITLADAQKAINVAQDVYNSIDTELKSRNL